MMGSAAMRILQYSLVRIIVAAAPIVLSAFALSALGLDDNVAKLVWAMCVPAMYVAYVRLVERRPIDELSMPGAGRELMAGIALGAALFAATLGVICAVGAGTVSYD